MTLLELRQRTYRMLGVDPTKPKFWTDAEIDRLINDAYNEVVKRSGALETRHTVSTQANQAVYALPAFVGRLMRVTFDDHKILPFTPWQFDREIHNWEEQTGEPTHYTIDGPDRTIRLWKTPDVVGEGADFDSEFGGVGDITDDAETFVFDSEFGGIGDITDGAEDFIFDSEFGIIGDIDFDNDNLEVWAKEVALPLIEDTDEPSTPGYSHLGLAFAATSRALRKRGDSRNLPLSKVFAGMANDYTKHLTHRARNRTMERTYEHGGRTTSTFLSRRREIRIPTS